MTAAGCIGFVYLYLKDVAYGASNTNVWNTTITPYAGFYAPSFAILRSDDDAAYAEFSTRFKPRCNYPAINQHDCALNVTEVAFNSQVYRNLRGYIFNGSDVFLKNLYEKVLLKLFVNYNSANISKEHENPSPQNPYLYFEVFDSALGSAPDYARFKEALDCGVIALSEMPALGSTTLSVIPYAVDDTLNALKLNDTTCIDIYNHGQLHLYYMSQLASTGVLASTSCDISVDRSKTSQPFQDCICQVIIRYGTTYLTTYNSKRQKEATDILIDMGGIVGGVCFVFWFWGILAVQ